MGRRWPPTAPDMQEAESLCRQLGLADLLDTMPSGILQMVGEGGWQLSHGERSRVYIARALLWGAQTWLSSTRVSPRSIRKICVWHSMHAVNALPTLMVIAHP